MGSTFATARLSTGTSVLLLLSLYYLPFASAFSFTIDTTPQQCANLSLSITGSDGTPPYSALVIPFGFSPLPNNIEARRIVAQSFGSGTSTSFKLNYPTNSQFIVVVSDSKAFGSGGTSAAAIVTSSSDSSCFDASTNVSPDFFYSIDPANTVVQCQTSFLSWNASQVQGTPTFYAVIPGGESFQIPAGPVTTVTGDGTGFNWTANVRAGNTLIIGAGDDRGLNSGGSNPFTVQAGQFPSNACLNDTSPSSTPGSPAGGTYPTSINGSGTGGGGSSSKTGPIVGGVIGGIVLLSALVMLLLFFRRRKRFHQQQARTDLFTDDEGPNNEAQGANGQLAPEPYIVSERETSEYGGTHLSGGGTSAAGGGLLSATGSEGYDQDRRFSATSTSMSRPASTSLDMMRPNTPGTSVSNTTGYTRKTAVPPVMRPVNVIQHDDAGVAPEGEEEAEAETVELPPAYTNIKRTTDV